LRGPGRPCHPYLLGAAAPSAAGHRQRSAGLRAGLPASGPRRGSTTMTYSPKQSRLTLAAAAILLGALPALAQGPANATREFRPYGDYMLVVDGQEVPNAEIYFSEKSPGFLVLTSKLDAPVLVAVSSQSVETVQLMKVAKQKDGTVDLLPSATLAPQGSFTVAGEGAEVSFKVDR